MGRLALAENLAVVEIPNLDLVGSTPLKAPQKSQNVTAELALAGYEVTPWGLLEAWSPLEVLGANLPLEKPRGLLEGWSP